MTEKIVNIVKSYIEEQHSIKDDESGNTWIHNCSITTTLTSFFLLLVDRETDFEVTIHRTKNLIKVNYKYKSEYTTKYDFMEILIELRKIINLSFYYAPPFNTEDSVNDEIVIYKRDKTIETLLI